MEKAKSKKVSKAKYVDGFVISINLKNLPAYKKMAEIGREVWMEHGALDYKECVGEDLDTKMGLSFPELTKSKKSETVIFSWITYSSKTDRNKVNAKVMKDPRMNCMEGQKMPFEMKRMSYGGFKVLVSS
ncbi:MAG: DUF1428 domain-containing protein [Ignavibacteria bacterium]